MSWEAGGGIAMRGILPCARVTIRSRRAANDAIIHATSLLFSRTVPPMLDPTLLRNDLDATAARLREARGFALDSAALESLEAERKRIQVRTQELQNLRNTRSKAIGQAKAKGGDVSALLAEVAGFGDELKAGEAQINVTATRPVLFGLRQAAATATRTIDCAHSSDGASHGFGPAFSFDWRPFAML